MKTQSRKKLNNPFKRLNNIAESMVEMLEHVRHLDNEEMPNACDVEDWLNLENELSTSSQMSDEEMSEVRWKAKVYEAMRKMRARTRN